MRPTELLGSAVRRSCAGSVSKLTTRGLDARRRRFQCEGSPGFHVEPGGGTGAGDRAQGLEGAAGLSIGRRTNASSLVVSRTRCTSIWSLRLRDVVPLPAATDARRGGLSQTPGGSSALSCLRFATVSSCFAAYRIICEALWVLPETWADTEFRLRAQHAPAADFP